MSINLGAIAVDQQVAIVAEVFRLQRIKTLSGKVKTS